MARRIIRNSFGAAALAAGALMSASCSNFNMVPRCEEMGEGIALALIPNDLVPPGGQIDRAKVDAIVEVRDLREVGAGYNQRVCRGTVALKDGSSEVTTEFKVEQSEGAQHWQDITFLGHGNPQFDRIGARVRSAYAGVQ